MVFLRSGLFCLLLSFGNAGEMAATLNSTKICVKKHNWLSMEHMLCISEYEYSTMKLKLVFYSETWVSFQALLSSQGESHFQQAFQSEQFRAVHESKMPRMRTAWDCKKILKN